MAIHYQTYPYTPILGWSLSRFEVFDKCKRQYFYTYYSKHVPDVPAYKLKQLRDLTSAPLEIGNIMHDLMEAFLHRLQKDDSAIDEERFRTFAHKKAAEYLSRKTFIETYYDKRPIDPEYVRSRINKCIDNFLKSPCFSWIYMKAIIHKNDWMIEPEGFGETRLGTLKAYCKMDFLFPVGNEVHILDWKTGKRDEVKHKRQLAGYVAAACSNFGFSVENVYARIVYLYPAFDELETRLTHSELRSFLELVQQQTSHMHAYCKDIEHNLPKPIEEFAPSPSPSTCGMCNYRELCFPEGLNRAESVHL